MKFLFVSTESQEPFEFEFTFQDNDVVSKYRYDILKTLLQEHKKDRCIEKIFNGSHVEVFKVKQAVFTKIVKDLSDPILLSPDGSQFSISIKSTVDIVEWNKLRPEIDEHATKSLVKNTCIYILESPEMYALFVTKWNNKKL